MALPVWPSTVPLDLDAQAFQLMQNHPAAAVTAFEDGPERMRRRSFTRIKKVTVRLPGLSNTQYAAFQTFVEDTLADGTGHFTATLMMPGSSTKVTRRCYIDGGAFTANEYAPTFWAVNFTLGVFPA